MMRVIPIPRGLGSLPSGALSASQIYQLAINAGFPPDSAVTAAAVALLESSGNPNAYNGVPPDASYGLWQINMLGNLGPARRAALGISSNDALYDPATNARAAFMLWAGNDANFSNWTMFKNGGYLAALPSVQAAAAAAGGAPVVASASDSTVGGSGLPGGLSGVELAVLVSLGVFAVVAIS